ncbi:MAG: FMN-binding glutamate synthase family protein, partial [Rhodospirillaceae bacterium]|nr:FMN-binding glutamate synthase family protein [Rhodospirillaceae bacterium]
MTRYAPLAFLFLLTLAVLVIGLVWLPALWGAAGLSLIVALGIHDLLQTRHSLLRNYPVVGHLRWVFEGIRPEVRQYLIESDRDEVPFSREQRSLVYRRAKGEEERRPFGTRHDVYEAGYTWLTHSMAPRPHGEGDHRIRIGGEACRRPYDASIYNISAMSFGSLGAHAIAALNEGARIGKFAHDTGEGGISRYHRRGGDLIWELGSGYFGCRDHEGRFDPARFAERAVDDQVKMVEVKLSQGAKPGHGGVLPGDKVTAEIAEARDVPIGEDCVSPHFHSAFSTPLEFVHFLQDLREGSGGKPVGFKLCVGHQWEVMALVKAMLETGILPDFIVVDGKEGGTGAAPLEFTNHVGTPLAEGLTFLRNALIGAGLRDRIRLGASGKLVTAFDLVWAHALGADWCNSARGFMFALGCIQAQTCHTNHCPTGVTTQDPLRQRALVVEDKAHRVARFHRNTLRALDEIVAAAGFETPMELQPWHLMVRQKSGEVLSADKAFPLLEPGSLLQGESGYDSYDG